MVRRRVLRSSAALALVVFAAGCSETQKSPLSPSAATSSGAATAPDGSTLKVGAPGIGGPSGGGRLTTRRPTFTWTTVSGQYASANPGYRFELLDAGGALLDFRAFPAGTTSYALESDLATDRVYQWRVRAELEGAFGPWSAVASFQTPAPPPVAVDNSLQGPRAADPGGAGRLPVPSYIISVINDEYNRNRNDWNNSCQSSQGERGWIWLDKLIDRLRTIDTRWGYNGKRGATNDPSQDIIDYHWGNGASEDSTAVYIIDVMNGHCGATPTPTYIDQTQITLSSGTIGRYIWRRPGRTTPLYYTAPVQ